MDETEFKEVYASIKKNGRKWWERGKSDKAIDLISEQGTPQQRAAVTRLLKSFWREGEVLEESEGWIHA